MTQATRRRSASALLVVVGLAIPWSSMWAAAIPTVQITTRDLPFTRAFPEGSTEALLVTITDDRFLASVPFTQPFTGPSESLSDLLTFDNVNGQATICFASDPDTGLCPTKGSAHTALAEQGAPVPNLFMLAGHTFLLSVTATSDANEATTGESDSLEISQVPEASTLAFLGAGILLACLLSRFRGHRMRPGAPAEGPPGFRALGG